MGGDHVGSRFSRGRVNPDLGRLPDAGFQVSIFSTGLNHVTLGIDSDSYYSLRGTLRKRTG